MAPNCSTLSESQHKMLEHIVLNIPAKFNIAQDSRCCIYRVPAILRKVNPEAYTPQLIAIGPLHHKDRKLKPMEREKYRYFHFFWGRCQAEAQELLQKYKSSLEKQEERIRLSYAEEFPQYNKDQFVEMILLDAVFIMELFLRFRSWKANKTNDCEENDDYMITKSWLHKSILRDLLLLENQIPMFVLKELYDTVVVVVAAADGYDKTAASYGDDKTAAAYGDDKTAAADGDDKNQTHSTFLKLAGVFFEIYRPKESPSSKETNKPISNWTPSSKQFIDSSHNPASKTSDKSKISKDWKNSRHFTDMIRYFYLPENLSFYEQKPLPSSVLKTATQLNEVGVTFEKVKHKCLLNIKFKKERFWSYFLCLSCLPKSRYFDYFKARFQIPQLKVDHSTECLFRNLIALEQCHYTEKPYICNYVSLIDSLIHTKDDVELLVEKEVISHDLGSHKELATLVNGLCKYVVVNSTCYGQTIEDLNTHYRNIWNRSMAALRLVYFRDPWRASSTLVGVAVLVFTIFNFCRIVRVVF